MKLRRDREAGGGLQPRSGARAAMRGRTGTDTGPQRNEDGERKHTPRRAKAETGNTEHVEV